MARFSTQMRQQRHEAILDAASRVAGLHGWGSLTMDAVAAEVGVAKGTLYLHFRGKEALLEALADRAAARLAYVIAEEGARAENPIDAARTVFHRFVVETEERASLAALGHSCLCVSPAAGQGAAAATRALVERIEQLLIAAQAGSDTPPGPRATAVTLLALATFSACLGGGYENGDPLSDSLRMAAESILTGRWGCGPDCPVANRTDGRGGRDPVAT